MKSSNVASLKKLIRQFSCLNRTVPLWAWQRCSDIVQKETNRCITLHKQLSLTIKCQSCVCFPAIRFFKRNSTISGFFLRKSSNWKKTNSMSKLLSGVLVIFHNRNRSLEAILTWNSEAISKMNELFIWSKNSQTFAQWQIDTSENVTQTYH